VPGIVAMGLIQANNASSVQLNKM